MVLVLLTLSRCLFLPLNIDMQRLTATILSLTQSYEKKENKRKN